MEIQLVDLSAAELDIFLEDFMQLNVTSTHDIESEQTPSVKGENRSNLDSLVYKVWHLRAKIVQICKS